VALYGCGQPEPVQLADCDPTVALLRTAAGEANPPGCPPLLTPDILALEPAQSPQPPPFRYPTAPPDMGSAELVERGHAAYHSDHLRDALVAYHQALDLDPLCEICRLRIDRIFADLDQRIEANLAAGQRYQAELRKEEATLAWERVLQLAPDPAHPAHVRALGYLE
jgi:tetratricopeptide (TPR) repeat protein